MKINNISIKVRRFGPLENVSFKLAPMMIFTGKSSLGKSYANYLVYYFLSSVCNGSLYDLVNKTIGDGENQGVNTFNLDTFLDDLSEHVELFMQKFLGDDELKCDVAFKSSKRKRILSFELRKIDNYIDNNEERSQIVHRLQQYELIIDGKRVNKSSSLEYAKSYLELILKDFVLGIYISRAVILPPGRGAFAGENFSIKKEVASSLNMYNYFFSDYDYGQSTRFRFPKDLVNELSERLLDLTSGGKLISVDGKQYLQITDTEKISLTAGASSVKDLAPWLFYLKNHWFEPFSICLEEPEAHQHPSVTVQIADVMAITMHMRSSNIFHLTTHSDYLLQRINQLIKLGAIRRKDIGEYNNICKERALENSSYLDAADIQAYYFSRNEKGKTVVESLKVTDDGIPMNSFFEVVSDLEEREEYINATIYRLSKDPK